MQVPTGADYSMTETERDEGEMEGERTTTTEDDDEGEEHTVTTVSHTSHTTSEDQDAESQSLRSGQMPSEHSFAGVVASTPARGNAKRGGGYGDTTQDSSLSSEASWTPSHGTMLNVLNQQIREGFKLDERAPQTKVCKYIHLWREGLYLRGLCSPSQLLLNPHHLIYQPS